MKQLSFTVAFPPTPWKRPAGSYQRYDSQVADKNAFALLVWQQLKSQPGLPDIQSEPFFEATTALRVKLGFYFKKPKSSKLGFPTHKNDIDNLSKFVLDALQSSSMAGRIWKDDGQVVSLFAEKLWAENDSISCLIGEII